MAGNNVDRNGTLSNSILMLGYIPLMTCLVNISNSMRNSVINLAAGLNTFQLLQPPYALRLLGPAPEFSPVKRNCSICRKLWEHLEQPCSAQLDLRPSILQR